MGCTSASVQLAANEKDLSEPVPVWEQQRSGAWVPFKDDCQAYIETEYQAYCRNAGEVRRLVNTTDDNGNFLKLSLDFGMLTSKKTGRSTDLYPIRRRGVDQAVDITVTTLAGVRAQVRLPRSSSLAILLTDACEQLALPRDMTKLLLGPVRLGTIGSLASVGINDGSCVTAVVAPPPTLRCLHIHHGELRSDTERLIDVDKSLAAQLDVLTKDFFLGECRFYLVPKRSELNRDPARDPEANMLVGRYGEPTFLAETMAAAIYEEYDLAVNDFSG